MHFVKQPAVCPLRFCVVFAYYPAYGVRVGLRAAITSAVHGVANYLFVRLVVAVDSVVII